jgi:hypothetical protein
MGKGLPLYFHCYRTESSCLDSDSEEDSEADCGSQATGGSAGALDGNNDDDLLSTSICHFEEETNKKRIGNNFFI